MDRVEAYAGAASLGVAPTSCLRLVVLIRQDGLDLLHVAKIPRR